MALPPTYTYNYYPLDQLITIDISPLQISAELDEVLLLIVWKLCDEKELGMTHLGETYFIVRQLRDFFGHLEKVHVDGN